MNLFLRKSSPGVLKRVHLRNLYIINKLQSSPGELKNKIKIKISSPGELGRIKSTSSLSELKNIIKLYLK